MAKQQQTAAAASPRSQTKSDRGKHFLLKNKKRKQSGNVSQNENFNTLKTQFTKRPIKYLQIRIPLVFSYF